MTETVVETVSEPPTEKSGGGLSILTRSLLGKISVAVLITAALSFAIVLFASLKSSKSIILEEFTLNSIAITNLLAANVTGGVRWNKSDVVAKAYEATVNEETSNAAAVIVVNNEGTVVSEYEPQIFEAAGLRESVDKFRAEAAKGAVSKMFGNYLLVVSPTGADKQSVPYGYVAILWQTDHIDEVLAANRNQSILYVAACLVLLVGVLIWLLRSQATGPLGEITRAIRMIAEGSSDVEIGHTERNDEIGLIAQALNVLRRNESERMRLAQDQLTAAEEKTKKDQFVHELINGFRGSVTEILSALETASSQMREESSNLAGIAHETSEKATSVAEASSAAATNVDTVAASTEELSSSIQEVSKQVEGNRELVNEGMETSNAANELVTGLSAAAQRIGDVVALIQDIADKTNLLALNATIEAARAGEMGKGFAVVASEVKTLANQTAKATEEITTQIEEIQASTSKSVDAIKAVTDLMGKINSYGAAAASALEEQTAATSEINRSIVEAAQGSRGVDENISGVREAINQTNASADQVRAVSTTLSDHATQLRKEVDRFLSEVEAA